MNDKYILEGKTPIPCKNLFEWAKWYETADRIVLVTKVGKVKVSTVFLGLDHSFGGKAPVLFETLVFGGKDSGDMNRYSTWEEAEEGHKEICKKVFRKPPPKDGMLV
jgi:hypothetical protein